MTEVISEEGSGLQLQLFPVSAGGLGSKSRPLSTLGCSFPVGTHREREPWEPWEPWEPTVT